MACLGYVGGSVTLAFAALVTMYTAQLLADLYVVNGKRQRTYTGMVKVRGERERKLRVFFCFPLAHSFLPLSPLRPSWAGGARSSSPSCSWATWR